MRIGDFGLWIERLIGWSLTKSTIPNPKSEIRNPQSAIRNPQSEIRNHVSELH